MCLGCGRQSRNKNLTRRTTFTTGPVVSMEKRALVRSDVPATVRQTDRPGDDGPWTVAWWEEEA